MQGEILYFDRPGRRNTGAVAAAVAHRAAELKIEQVVVASNTGATALAVHKALRKVPIEVVAVAEHAGFHGGDKITMTAAQRQELERLGIKVFVGAHALSGVARSITNRFGGVSHVEIIAHTLRQFGGEGIKVAVEVAVMAADAGLIPTDREVIAVGGTAAGADAAIVVRSAHMNNFFDLEIREIIAKPRQRKPERPARLASATRAPAGSNPSTTTSSRTRLG
ncbi:MAG: pyruvate kinase alpha/beta domain-containing protein [Candidatus Latescibacterota bacterium]|jgi:hypothetical protein